MSEYRRCALARWATGLLVAALWPGVAAAGAAVMTVVLDDFETGHEWEFRTVHGGGALELSHEQPHAGKGCLRGNVSRGTLTLTRELELTERGSRLRFWFRPIFDASRLTDVVLTVALRSGTTGQLCGVRLVDPRPGTWQLFETDVGRLSTSLVGERITAVHVGLSSWAGPLDLCLDDFSLTSAAEQSAAAVRPPVRPPAEVGLPTLQGVTPLLAKALSARMRLATCEEPRCFAALAASGMNAVALPVRSVGTLIEAVGRAHQRSLAAFAVFPVFRVGLRWGEKHVGRAAGLPQSVCRTLVCPFDWPHWDTMVRGRLREIAQVAELVPLDGILFDLHLYGAVHPTLADTRGCLCADCFDAYIRSHDAQCRLLDARAPDRLRWLWERGQVRDFYEYQERRLLRWTKDVVEEQVPKEAQVLVGVLDYEHHWTGDALVRGVLAARGAALVLCRAPCRQGYSLETDRLVDHVRGMGAGAVCVPGVGAEEMTTERLPLEMFHTAMNSGGYWLSSGRHVRGDGAPPNPFAWPSDDLLRACAAGNRQVSEWMRRSD